MKKVFFTMGLVAVSALALTSCNNSPKDEDSKSVPTVAQEMKIAYIESDSIQNQYKLALDLKEIMDKKQNNMQSTVASSAQALQAAQQKLQDDYKNNRITSQEELQQRSQALQAQEQKVQALQQRLSAELENEYAKYQQELQDSVNNFLKQYNKDKKYSFILTKGGVSNILYADKSCDITAEVVAGLNKCYKPAKKTDAVAAKETKTADKK